MCLQLGFSALCCLLLFLRSASADLYRPPHFCRVTVFALLFPLGCGPGRREIHPVLQVGLEPLVTQLQGGRGSVTTSPCPHFGGTPKAEYPSWYLEPPWSLAKQLTNPVW